MKRISILFSLVFAAGWLVAPSPAQAEGVVLTDAVIQRYLNTFPGWYQTSKDMEATDQLSDGPEKDEKIAEINKRRETSITSKGWTDVNTFNDYHQKIVQGLIPTLLVLKFAKAPAQARKQMEDNVKDTLKDFTPEERKLMKKYAPRLHKMLKAAGLADKDS